MKNRKNNYCVYVHIFPNKKKYVGQTSDPAKRWANGKGYARQRIVYAAIKKYGWENIDHIIVADGLSKAEADDLERKLIADYDAIESGYNVLIGGKTVPRYEWTQEHSRNIALAKMKRVNCYTRSGDYVATFRSIMEAAEWVGGSLKTISSCCNGDKKSAYGYIWRKCGEPFDKYETENRKGGARKIPVVAYTLSGEYVGLFDSAKTASETLKVNATSIALVCKGKKPQVGGYTFRYFNEEEGSEDGQ